MKLFNYREGDGIALGALTEKGHVDLSATAKKAGLQAPCSVDAVIACASERAKLEKLLAAEPVLLDEGKIAFAPAVARPEKILCIGLNYAAHARETNIPLPEAPVVFTKYLNALNHHGGTIKLRQAAKMYDYEAELVIVIGKEASAVPKERALDYVFGYTCGNDFSARDIQKRTSQWTLGKSMDGFGPVGPYVVTADSIDGGNLKIATYVNGEQRQSSNTNDLIFGIEELIADITSFMTLKPGDLIFTGTPNGVITAYPPEKQVWLKAGDVVEVEIEGIGKLKTTLE
ncbi:MAG: fumarylacetoacetate hydrolase family protein [Christensenellaceae bacterium]|jgi:2-keto-4-pentenoate hydratase/2-oxohepta-3-ene-1,7-dioic acid hydratase in catechol pathway|nr:fumarylacetoacetate hydrolase family protein [Christensenellaceae bacterium]